MVWKRPSPKVIYIEDDRDTRELYAMALRDAGFTVREAATAAEALMACAEFEPEVVVTDLRGPQLDGLEIISRLRGDPRTAATPVIVLTGWVDKAYRERVVAAGARFLAKPCMPDELTAEILRALKGS